jgi:hypothetical protein
MRTSILGILNYDDLDQVIANTIRIAKVRRQQTTHGLARRPSFAARH